MLVHECSATIWKKKIVVSQNHYLIWKMTKLSVTRGALADWSWYIKQLAHPQKSHFTWLCVRHTQPHTQKMAQNTLTFLWNSAFWFNHNAPWSRNSDLDREKQLNTCFLEKTGKKMEKKTKFFILKFAINPAEGGSVQPMSSTGAVWPAAIHFFPH